MHQAQKPAEKVLKIETVWNAIDTSHLLQSCVELEYNQAQYIYDLINLAPNELAAFNCNQYQMSRFFTQQDMINLKKDKS